MVEYIKNVFTPLNKYTQVRNTLSFGFNSKNIINTNNITIICKVMLFMKRYFRVVIEKDEDGVYIATVPELPGCVSDGKTRREALTNVKEAISGYLETLKDMNWAMPKIVGVDRVLVERKCRTCLTFPPLKS